MQATARVVVIHDCPLLFEGVRAIFASEPGFEVVGEARNATDVLLLCSENPPDVVIVELGTDDAEARRMLIQVRELCADIRTVVLTSVRSPNRVRAAVTAGAQALVSRNAANEQVIAAVRSVIRNQCYVDPELAGVLVATIAMTPEDTLQTGDARYRSLTIREREVFRLLADGMNNKSIAYYLGISHKTVETHHLRIMRKLGLADTVELIRYAAQIGLIEVHDWASDCN
ncbi:MAG: DNA-binding response regulator [Spirochaetaceae bacterium]|nr:MAG: DNA-binding response regulator [Spirochaetaceae bacterium]